MVGTVRISSVTIAAILIATCYAAYVQKSPARVLISQDRSSKNALNVDIEEYGQVHKLRMTPAKNIWAKYAKIVELKSKRGTNYLQDIELDQSEKLKIYKDSKVGAVLAVKNGRISGIVDENLTAKTEDEKQFLYKSFKRLDDSLEIPDLEGNTTSTRKNFQYRNDYLEIPEEDRPNTTDNFASARQSGSYIVEVAAVIDSTLFAEFPNYLSIFEYLTIFWNAVDERYNTIASPNIEIKVVAAIIISQSGNEPFINSNILNANQINGIGTIVSFSQWVKTKEGTLPDADIYYLHTGKDMVYNTNAGLAGVAYRGGACQSNSAQNFAVGVGEDRGGFYNGVHTAGHEVAHLLGAPHDGIASLNTGSCPWSDGYIMSYIAGTINRLFFSTCSVERMNNFLSNPAASCLSASSTVSQNPCLGQTDDLPGDVLSMDQQCKELTGNNNAAVFTNLANQNMLCYNMLCLVPNTNGGGSIYSFGAVAAENVPCPFGGRCVDGACV